MEPAGLVSRNGVNPAPDPQVKLVRAQYQGLCNRLSGCFTISCGQTYFCYA